MKLKTATALFAIGGIILAFSPIKETKMLEVDTSASMVEWVAEKVTGKHNGTVDLKSGELELKDGKLIGGSFVANMSTIKVTDLEGEMAKKLEGHLNSEDFFGAEKYPTAVMKFNDVKYVEEDAMGFNTEIIGYLTIKEKTQPITFPARVQIKDGKVAAYAEVTVDRTLFNVRYGSASFFDNLGDKTIYDEFILKVSLGGKD